jgi:hypothetical protein
LVSGGERRGVSPSEFAKQLFERLRFPGDRRRAENGGRWVVGGGRWGGLHQREEIVADDLSSPAGKNS